MPPDSSSFTGDTSSLPQPPARSFGASPAELAELRSALTRLRQAATFTQLLEVIDDLVSGLIGGRSYAIVARGDAEARAAGLQPRAIHSRGRDEAIRTALAADELRQALEEGAPFLALDGDGPSAPAANRAVEACVPFWGLHAQPRGALVIAELEAARGALRPRDRRLLMLMGSELADLMDALAGSPAPGLVRG